ncbi:hypothetical protein WDW89_24700 [Deltaproteobacteria bacterium TL4]
MILLQSPPLNQSDLLLSKGVTYYDARNFINEESWQDLLTQIQHSQKRFWFPLAPSSQESSFSESLLKKIVEHTSIPVLPITFLTCFPKHFVLKDGFVLPYPFTRALMIVGNPVSKEKMASARDNTSCFLHTLEKLETLAETLSTGA